MKIRSLFSCLLLVVVAGASFAQSVKITPKKTVYHRIKPMDSGRRSFIITYPKVTGLSPALNRRVESTLSYEKLFDFKVSDELRDEQWLEEASYEINYNKRGILVVTLRIEGSGAYPSTSSRTLVVDPRTGNRVTPSQAFTNLPALAAMCKKAQEKEIKTALSGKGEDVPDKDLFKETDFKVKDLSEFLVQDTGVTFLYDYGFPHVVLALQPDGRYVFTWKEIKPFINRRGLLHQFVH